jgi:hypothetical protein
MARLKPAATGGVGVVSMDERWCRWIGILIWRAEGQGHGGCWDFSFQMRRGVVPSSRLNMAMKALVPE